MIKNGFLITVFLCISNSFVITAKPAYADTEVCVNKVLQENSSNSRFEWDKATQEVEVVHEGITYHWIKLSNSRDGSLGHDSVFATNDKGLCKLVLVEGPGPLPSIEDYYKVLGREVTDKFLQAFREQR